MSINPAFQILGEDRRASRSCFIVHICPFPIKQMTPLTHIAHIHDLFPIHFDRLAMDFSRVNVFHVKNRITEFTLQSAWLVIVLIPYKSLWHSNQFTQCLGKYWWRGRGSDDGSRCLKTSGQLALCAGCANGSYFKMTFLIIGAQKMFVHEAVVSFIVFILNANKVEAFSLLCMDQGCLNSSMQTVCSPLVYSMWLVRGSILF
jgi:hypothetical protein